MPDDDAEPHEALDSHELPGRATPGGPYFGRLLIVLLVAVAFCGFMTWLLTSVTAD